MEYYFGVNNHEVLHVVPNLMIDIQLPTRLGIVNVTTSLHCIITIKYTISIFTIASTSSQNICPLPDNIKVITDL
jgi:hypothetical protein